ncbi:MAG TPA: D-2-hydroxyacid dehydrogenase [Pseudomonadaceae bacterium]|nr:D-2-hydroxyacid dehydrogenase [Pseudomonadaceae bacterium]
MSKALYFQPSYERLKERIHALAPDLDVALYDEQGRILHGGHEVSSAEFAPEYFWIHGDLFKSARLMDYFRLMQESPSARWLHTINTGLDQLPYLPLLEKGVRVSNNHGQAVAIGEYVLAHVLASFQDLAGARQRQLAQQWTPRGFREIGGSRWLIIGFGHIGQEVAKRARAFGADITAMRRKPDTAGLADRVVSLAELPQVLPEVDVVVLACTSTNATRQLVNASFLQAMKSDAVLVNVARGDLVVEDELRQALDAGRPGKAILDVFANEPLAADSWFWQHPAVIVTPHNSNAGSGMRVRSEQIFLDNLACMIAGRPLLTEVAAADIL